MLMNTKIPNLHLEPISLEYKLFELYITIQEEKQKSLGQQLDDLQTELNRFKELEKLFDKAVKFQLYV